MHQIDGGVRFQQVAPGALTCMRFARNKQHTQIFAHAFSCNHGAVVGRCQFARYGIEFNFDDVGAGVGKRHVDLIGAADFGAQRFVRAAFAADLQGYRHPCDGRFARLANGQLNGARLPDEAIARRFDDFDAAVEFVFGAGQQRVHWRVEAEALRRLRHVMHLPVGNEQNAGDAVGRGIAQRGVEIGEQVGSGWRLVSGLGTADPLDVEVWYFRELGFEIGLDRGGLFGALGQLLAGRFVQHDDRDVG